eukprot:gb/GFBE01049228.1/.p1 GENE.gb/GFBE01049228.1/~~gb/GFBE01049228.1/.p1  ORF type:complete len:819 (+),score=174.70 gb/GFBE01049228.1/:1-2457(+)
MLLGRSIFSLEALSLVALHSFSLSSLCDAAEPSDAELCPEMYDINGEWQGSRAVGGNYTLVCAQGFEVSGHSGSVSKSLICPESLRWPQELSCVNVDDCASLRHGCGALGLCLDLVDGYDCNCERGYNRRHHRDGEIVCGPKDIPDSEICHGQTCSAYGVCIDLVGNSTGYESEEADEPDRPEEESTTPQYRCECTDGFYDDGVTCQRHDCGEKKDAIGVWTGSTKFGGEYTLRCPQGAFVWGGELQEVTLSCGRKGNWLSDPICISPLDEEVEKEMAALSIWVDIGVAILCVCSAALAAGLTLGLLSMEPFGLTVILAARLEECSSSEEKDKLQAEQAHARRILPVVRDHHLLLVTLLLFNTVANETLPVFLDKLVPSWAAVLMSVSVVLVCGEILPSAVFTGPSQFAIASACVPLVRLMQAVFFVAAKPIAMVLDHIIKHEEPEDGAKYSRAQLRALLHLHGPLEEGDKEEEDLPKMPSLSSLSQWCLRPDDCEASEIEMSATADAHLPAAALSSSAEPEEEEDELDDEEGGSASSTSVIAKSELRLMAGVMNLQEKKLSKRCYTQLKCCWVASGQESAVSVLEKCAMADGHRSVIVLHDGSTASASPRRGGQEDSDNDGPGSPTSPVLRLRASSVAGCIEMQELLKGGLRPLNTLCLKPLVLLPEDSNLLKVVSKLRDQSVSSAIVVRKSFDGDVVKGAVHLSQVLAHLVGPSNLRQPSSSSPTVSPGLRPQVGPSTAHRRRGFAALRSKNGVDQLRLPASAEISQPEHGQSRLRKFLPRSNTADREAFNGPSGLSTANGYLPMRSVSQQSAENR